MTKTEPIPVLYRDEDLVGVAKPPGLLVHRSSEAPDRDVLMTRVRDQEGRWVYPVHRVDRGTSGVVLFAWTSEGARDLHERLGRSTALKEYLVLCRGSTPQRFESRRPLGGKPARTEFEKVAEFHRSSLLRARLRSGRRHQIRRHLAHLAHQVIGDRRYGKSRINAANRALGLERIFLHARRVAFEHPRSGERIEIDCPLPEDLRRFLARVWPEGGARIATL
ncbi:MAG: pseudouridylate synthase [Planctomycetota bacterium]|nr:MAG: pseudouridylate synthase [Planctomycetota bacterium]